jgi:hypothetical protein
MAGRHEQFDAEQHSIAGPAAGTAAVPKVLVGGLI